MNADRAIRAAAASAVLLALAGAGFTASESAKMRQARELFASGKPEDALAVYEDVLRSNPSSAVANFNVGMALYGKKDYIEAIKSFQAALATEDEALEKDALAFIGNSYFNLAEEAAKADEVLASRSLREALGYYRRAIGIDDRDRNVAYNYELASRRLYHLATGDDGASGAGAKEAMRSSVGALIREDEVIVRARRRDAEIRAEASRIAARRREEDRTRREARRSEDRSIDAARRAEDEAAASSGDADIAGRERNRRAEDEEREAARRVEDAAREAERRQEDARIEGPEAPGAPEADEASITARRGWFALIAGCAEAYADEPTPAAGAGSYDLKDVDKLYAARRAEDLDRAAKRRSEDAERDARRRSEDAWRDSARRAKDALIPQGGEEAGPASREVIALEREKEDLEKELARIREDRAIVMTRNREDLDIAAVRSREDAATERQRARKAETAMAAQGGREGAISEVAGSARQAAAYYEQAAASAEAASGGIAAAMAEAGASAMVPAGGASAAAGASATGAGGAAADSMSALSQEIAGLKEIIGNEQSKMAGDISFTGGIEIGSEITGKLASDNSPGGTGGGAPPKADRSALEELEDALKRAGKKEEKKDASGEAPEKIRDKDAEFLLETYWQGEAPKKIIERERSPDYRKDAKEW